MIYQECFTAQQGSKISDARLANNLFCKAHNIEDAVQAVVNGISLVVVNVGVQRCHLIDLCERLRVYYNNAPFSKIDEIRGVLASTLSIRLSLDSHPAHSDGSFEENPPRKFLLQFANIDPGGGGTSLFWPSEELLVGMPKHYKHVLLTSSFRFRHGNLDGTYKDFISPVLSYRPNGKTVIRFASDRQVSLTPLHESMVTEGQALEWLKHRISNTSPIQYQAQVGDIIIVDNDDVLHGRSRMSSQEGRQRLVRRVYLECPNYFTGLEHVA